MRSPKFWIALTAVNFVLALALGVYALGAKPGPTEAQQPAAVLRAQAIELVDKQGRVVAQLHLGEDGGGNLRLRSAEGMVRVKLGATADGSGLLLFDKEAEPAVSLAANKAGTSATLAEKGKEKRILKP